MNELAAKEAVEMYVGEVPIDFSNDSPGWAEIYYAIGDALDFPPTTRLMDVVEEDVYTLWDRYRLSVYDVISEYENEFVSEVAFYMYEKRNGFGSYGEDYEQNPYFWEEQIEDIGDELESSGEAYTVFWEWTFSTWKRKSLFFMQVDNYTERYLGDWPYNEREIINPPFQSVW